METYRYGGHFVGDAEEYRVRDVVEERRRGTPSPRPRRCCCAGGVDPDVIEAVWHAARAEVEHAVGFAEESPYPDASTAADDLFASPAVTT